MVIELFWRSGIKRNSTQSEKLRISEVVQGKRARDALVPSLSLFSNYI